MNTFTKIALATSSLLIAPIALGALPSLSFVEVNYASFEDDELSDAGLDFSGFELNASIAITDNFYIPLSYSVLSDDSTFTDGFVNGFESGYELEESSDIDFKQTTIGIGYALPISDNGFFYGELAYLKIDFDISGTGNFTEFQNGEIRFQDSYSFSEGVGFDGQYLEAGYQHKFDNGFQTNLGALHRRITEDGETLDDTSAFVEILYNFTDNLAVKAGYETGDKRLALGARYNF